MLFMIALLALGIACAHQWQRARISLRALEDLQHPQDPDECEHLSRQLRRYMWSRLACTILCNLVAGIIFGIRSSRMVWRDPEDILLGGMMMGSVAFLLTTMVSLWGTRLAHHDDELPPL